MTCFRKRNNKKLCIVKYFPFSERTRLYAYGLRRRELSQESRIPRHQGIKLIRVNYFNE